MKKILMSFRPSVYDRIVAQTKLIEFRRHYPEEETLVYMYVSKPYMEIKGIVILGKRIEMSKAPVESSFYLQALHDGYKPDQYVYGMPIRSIQITTSISLACIQSHIPNFKAPQSYYYLDKKPELLQLIEDSIKTLSKCVNNTLELPAGYE